VSLLLPVRAPSGDVRLCRVDVETLNFERLCRRCGRLQQLSRRGSVECMMNQRISIGYLGVLLRGERGPHLERLGPWPSSDGVPTRSTSCCAHGGSGAEADSVAVSTMPLMVASGSTFQIGQVPSAHAQMRYSHGP
jgi:hypothetical protein